MPPWLLLLTVFVTGASILIIELIGTRVLAPFFGSGIYTWSSLISVALAALALGYHAGGVLADKSPQPRLLYYLCLIAGLWTLITPWLATLILPNIVHLADFRLMVLFASVLLFSPSLFVLGMACPFTIRLFSRDHEASGRTSGRVFSVSTIGSLLAALLTGFLLVPNFGVLHILTICGLALVVLAIFGLVFVKRFKVVVLALLVSSLAALPAFIAKPQDGDALELVDSSPSFYGNVQVVRRHRFKLLLVNGFLQNQALYSGEYNLPYVTFFSTLPSFREWPADNPPTGLVIGLGAGQLPMMLKRNGVGVEAVEIDPVMEAMARKHFDFDLDRDRIHFTDGRLFLNGTDNFYDYIFLDAYSADMIPWHLLSREGLELARSRMKPGGVLGINAVSIPASKDLEAVHATLREVFPRVRVFNQTPDSRLANFLFLASNDPIKLKPYGSGLTPLLARSVKEHIDGEILELAESFVLNDNYNPINHLHESAQQEWRRNMREFLGREYYHWAFY